LTASPIAASIPRWRSGSWKKVSRNGQVSAPAAVRHRWGTSTVLIIDRGDYAIVRPIPDDPIEALRGAYATPGPDADAARAADRAAEAASDDRRQGLAG
jgi:bifunctional DNA-binding transcriptional regulator/antitoxin component of YhaV-PrlF toxin-antitoxin module